MTRKALGRGLSALLGDDSAPKTVSPAKITTKTSEDYFELDLDLIRPNADQPRTSFPDATLEELAQSIRSNGVVQPILVRRQGQSYEIVAGERRWRAAQRAELRKIPVIVKEVADDKLLELALIENIQRQELNPIEEAKAYKKLIESLGLTQQVVAGRVGKDRTFIANYQRLLKLPDDIQALVADGRLSVGHARSLLMIDGADTQRRMARNIIEKGLSVRETERAVKKVAHGAPIGAVKKPVVRKQDANIKAAETKLRRHFGTQVRIIAEGQGNSGRIELEYYSASDLDRIYRLMMAK